jgi:hypothetical protein
MAARAGTRLPLLRHGTSNMRASHESSNRDYCDSVATSLSATVSGSSSESHDHAVRIGLGRWHPGPWHRRAASAARLAASRANPGPGPAQPATGPGQLV